MGGFNQRLMDIATTVGGETDPGALARNKQTLVEILGEVISDLDREKVSQDEFEHFSFTWQAVDALVRDQMTLARDANPASTEEGAA